MEKCNDMLLISTKKTNSECYIKPIHMALIQISHLYEETNIPHDMCLNRYMYTHTTKVLRHCSQEIFGRQPEERFTSSEKSF